MSASWYPVVECNPPNSRSTRSRESSRLDPRPPEYSNHSPRLENVTGTNFHNQPPSVELGTEARWFPWVSGPRPDGSSRRGVWFTKLSICAACHLRASSTTRLHGWHVQTPREPLRWSWLSIRDSTWPQSSFSPLRPMIHVSVGGAKLGDGPSLRSIEASGCVRAESFGLRTCSGVTGFWDVLCSSSIVF